MTAEKLTKKAAEVAALCDLLRVLDVRSGGRLGDLRIKPAAWRRLGEHDLPALVAPDMRPVFEDKYERTVVKITGMMEMYIGSEWDNDIEILEWCGFHLGAGLVHAALIQGGAQGELQAAAAGLVRDYRAVLTGVAERLQAKAEA